MISRNVGIFTPTDLNMLDRVLERAYNDLFETPDYGDRDHLAAILLALRQSGNMDEDDLFDALVERARPVKAG